MSGEDKKIHELELPSGAVIKLRRLSVSEIRIMVFEAMIKGFAKPGIYEANVEEDGSFDPMNLMIFDMRFIELWTADQLGAIKDHLRRSMRKLSKDIEEIEV